MKFWRSFGSAGLKANKLCCLWVKLKRCYNERCFQTWKKKVLQQIENGTEELNDIHVESGISMNQLLGVILELELKGIVQQNNSSTYSIKEEIVLQ